MPKKDPKKDRNPAHSPGRGGREVRRCTACNGRGTVKDWYKDGSNVWRSRDIRCSTCGGRGETR